MHLKATTYLIAPIKYIISHIVRLLSDICIILVTNVRLKLLHLVSLGDPIK